MESHKVFTESEEPLKGLVLSIENGLFILISEDTFKMGTVALALPVESGDGHMLSYVLPAFGSRNELLAKSIAERVAKDKKKIVIASIMIKEEKPELINKTLSLVKKLSVLV